MRLLLLILLLASPCLAQTKEPAWKLINEMSGEIPNHPGLIAEVYAAEVARGDDRIKLIIRIDYPWGAPRDIFKDSVPWGFDPTSISRIVGKIQLNCKTLIVKPVKEAGEIYQFNGKKYKSKEPAFAITEGNVLAEYFCERGPAPTKAPILKP